MKVLCFALLFLVILSGCVEMSVEPIQFPENPSRPLLTTLPNITADNNFVKLTLDRASVVYCKDEIPSNLCTYSETDKILRTDLTIENKTDKNIMFSAVFNTQVVYDKTTQYEAFFGKRAVDLMPKNTGKITVYFPYINNNEIDLHFDDEVKIETARDGNRAYYTFETSSLEISFNK